MTALTPTLERLAAIIAERAQSSGDVSYTRKLLDGGVTKIGKKLGEEAFETVIAAMQDDPAGLRGEIADLLYHLLVLMQARGVALSEVAAVLDGRFAQSGLAEKAGRPKS